MALLRITMIGVMANASDKTVESLMRKNVSVSLTMIFLLVEQDCKIL